MKYRGILLAVLIITAFVGNAEAQDSLSLTLTPTKRNSLSLGIIDLPNRRISLTYARKLKSGHEFFVNPRVRIAGRSHDSNTNSVGLFSIDDPQWYYNKYHFRTGIIFHVGKVICIEPQLDFGYGEYYDKSISSDLLGWRLGTVRMDRQYRSVGLLCMMSWILDYKYVRLKPYWGAGYSSRNIHERVLGEEHSDGSIEYYPYPQSSELNRKLFTLHIGVDLGLRW